MLLDVGPLRGQLVHLEPLAVAHADDLAAAADHDRSTFTWTSVPHAADEVRHAIDELLAARDAGECVPFAQVRASDGVAVGSTRFLTIRRRPTGEPYAVEIGGTWLAASAQRTGLNVEAKYLLLAHAFDAWGVGRVDFKTDARNERSRTAIGGLGARFEGVLRNWQPSHAVGEDGLLRDSAMFSIAGDDWPEVRRHLERRLQDGAATPPR